MAIVRKIKDQITSTSQKALGIDGLRFNLQVALEKLERIYQVEAKLAQLEATSSRVESMSARISDQIQNLKSFLTWSSNRVEPWFWTGNFSHSDPEEELAGLLFNFLPNRVLVEVESGPSNFTKAATEIGYQVFRVEPPNTVVSLVASKALPGTIDFLNIARKGFGLDMVKAFDFIRPAVIQTEFLGDDLAAAGDPSAQEPSFSSTEIMKEMRNREYYWNIVIFRTEVESFIRMATNLAGVPERAWGRLLFFYDYQLFLKAFHWCKTTLPRFRAAPLA